MFDKKYLLKFIARSKSSQFELFPLSRPQYQQNRLRATYNLTIQSSFEPTPSAMAVSNELRFKCGILDEEESDVNGVKEYMVIIWKRFTCKTIFTGENSLADLIKHNSYGEIKPPYKTFIVGNRL